MDEMLTEIGKIYRVNQGTKEFIEFLEARGMTIAPNYKMDGYAIRGSIEGLEGEIGYLTVGSQRVESVGGKLEEHIEKGA